MRHALIRARKERNETQAQVAKALGITRPYYTQIELGERDPSLDVALKLSEHFGLPVEQLLAKDREVERVAG